MEFCYFLESLPGTGENEVPGKYRLYAVIEEHYYWSIEWSESAGGKEALITGLEAGMIATVKNKVHAFMRELTAAELREELGSFAYFIERAVNGYRSYLMWINPDIWQKSFPWQVPLS